jgi:hypothetical protein
MEKEVTFLQMETHFQVNIIMEGLKAKVFTSGRTAASTLEISKTE